MNPGEMMPKLRGLSKRQVVLLKILKDNPNRQYSFIELGDRFQTSASAVVSMIRSIAARGHGEFRDQVMGEKYLPKTPEREAARKLRLEKRHCEASMGLL